MPKQLSLIYLLVSLFFSHPVIASAANQRGIVPVPIKDRSGNQVFLYQESHALLVGVSEYSGGWSNLPGVRKDLKEFRRLWSKKALILL